MDIHQEKDFGAPVTKGRIRMAYALGNGQPVLCTLLCDQPLYYMEEEILEDEDDGLFLEEERSINAALGADFGSLQKKISIYDGVARKFAPAPDARLQGFGENAASFGAPARNAAAMVQDLMALCDQSRYAQALRDQAMAHGVRIQTSRQTQGAEYDHAAQTILINPDQTPADAVLGLVRALRRHAQVIAGAGAHPLTYHPDEAILINRAQAADIAVTQIRVGWELQLAGHDDVWARLENTQGSDLARAFAREALYDFRTLNNGKAAQAAFESWFLSDRCKIEDRDLIQAMLVDQEARRFDNAGNQLNQTFLAALGEQPTGRNYLAEQASTILSDPIFSDVRDRSNANFLWFVKFERSFHEAEEAAPAGQGTIHSFEAPQNIAAPTNAGDKKDRKSAAYNQAAGETLLAPAPAGLEGAANRSNIVYVSFGR